MSEEQEKEIKMLQEYITALEKQNSSRNSERQILIQEIDGLYAENQNLKN